MELELKLLGWACKVRANNAAKGERHDKIHLGKHAAKDLKVKVAPRAASGAKATCLAQ